MTDADLAHQKERIERLRAKWVPLLLSNDWLVHIRVEDRPADMAGDTSIPMCSYPEWAYQKTVIAVAADVCLDATDEAMEHYVIHELLHCTVDEIAPPRTDTGADPHEERVVSALQRAIGRVYQAGWDAALAGLTQIAAEQKETNGKATDATIEYTIIPAPFRT